MDPVELARKVEERYRRYLKTTFYFRDPVLRASFEQALKDTGRLSKGPYLEATPVFKRGQTPRELFQGLLGYAPPDSFLNAVQADRPLYQHQEEAIRRVFEGRNVVVATGTGSGKTEAFLYPIFLHLYREFKESKLGPGVRALILYPMNALANDQRERLGEICMLLKNSQSPFRFTFGQYTGDTPENESDSYRNAHSHIDGRYEGELVLRKEMRQQPPHILLTNYSMLEYLLLRPKDSELFDDGRAKWWTFLVLDEAHQYRGSKGIEMAMLIRRLKRRLREGKQAGEFRCIATSASIAGDKEDGGNVAKFAESLFGEKFREEDVILGETEPLPEEGAKSLPSDAYFVLRKSIEAHTNEIQAQLSKLATDLDVPLQADEEMPKKVGRLLQQDNRAIQLRRRITGTPMEVQAIANEVFGDLPDQQRAAAVSELVELLLKATDPVSDSPLLSARYHLFLRSLEGAFVAYWPEKKVYLDRQTTIHDGAAFEIALCRECGQHYFVGKLMDGKLREAMRDPGHPDFGADFFRPVEAEEIESDDDDDGDAKQKQSFRLCVQCGEMWQAKLGPSGGRCGHHASLLVVMQETSGEKESEKGDQTPKCDVCGYQAPDPVREVVHGTDGPHAVIATTLHQNLPNDRKKVLAFADGRQEAAFFAWYLEQSYKDIRNRNLILQTTRRLSSETTEGLSIQTLSKHLRDRFRELKVFKEPKDDIELRREAWLALYREFLTDEPRISLEGVGLLHWTIQWPDGFTTPEVLLRPPFSLSEREARDLMAFLFGLLRRERAVELQTENAVSISWEELGLQHRQVAVEIERPQRKPPTKSINGWTGAKTPSGKRRKSMARMKFLMRILMDSDPGLEEDAAAEDADKALREIWGAVRQWGEQRSTDERLLLRVGDAHRLNPDWWRAFPIGKDERLFQCDTCGRLQKVSIRGICSRHKCLGKLKAVHPAELENVEENHYRLLYDEDIPARLVVEEHTAQIDKERAREFQRDFKQNKIDVLSCSTTFELGVDLGDLDTIFLRNVPPEAFNYAQRVGRAGRRKGYPGIAITYCKRGPHDLYHFADPQRMLKGTTQVPVLSLTNEKIILRHVAATAFSRFFRAFRVKFENVGALFKDLEQPTGTSDLREFLQANGAELEDTLCAVVSQQMAEKIGLKDGTWIENVAGDNSRFWLAEAEVSSDYKSVKEFETTSAQKRDYKAAERASARVSTIAGEDVLSFLSRKAVIPKYGFPVDVVELDTHPVRTGRSRESIEVSLQRDLAIAVAEFAPTSKLVANKKEWESKGLKKVAGKEWPRKFYRRCIRHNFFKQWGQEDVEPPGRCSCERMPSKYEYVDPIFGFVTTLGKPEEPKRRPAKTFTTRPYFVGFSGSEPGELSFSSIQLTKTSPGTMVVLCEGRKGEGFRICETCAAGVRQSEIKKGKGHNTPFGTPCFGSVQSPISLGHEFPTDVLRMQFLTQPPLLNIDPVWFAYSLAYAVVEGAAEILEVPSSDLNATVAYGSEHFIPPIVLYDNVPGGAGLVARLEDKSVLKRTLEAARTRVKGTCNCGEDTSCYGCLRSYRNQFAHQHLRRGPVMHYLEMMLAKW
jgi:ATP-dependent helicase YprA (DUF1998 family)